MFQNLLERNLDRL